ncbi:hypothetical protein LCGC14_2655160, partial [marine sediment metagenome]
MTDSRSQMISVKELEVVGYADVLRPGTIPRRVAPIFRYRVAAGMPMDQARYVFPPFRLVDEFVINGTVGIESDLDTAVTDIRATRLDQPILAQPSSVLWIDENLDSHYGPQKEINANLQRQAMKKYRQAKEAFQQGQYEKARQLARWAFAADQRCWLALALQAAMRQLEGDEQAVAVMGYLAADLVAAEDFGDQVDRLAQEVSAKRVAEFAPPQQEKSEDDSEKLRAVGKERVPPSMSNRLFVQKLQRLGKAKPNIGKQSYFGSLATLRKKRFIVEDVQGSIFISTVTGNLNIILRCFG